MELRRAEELRSEFEKGNDLAFKETWSKVVNSINEAHSNGHTLCSLESIVKGLELKRRINDKLGELGYSVSEHSDYRDSYYNGKLVKIGE